MSAPASTSALADSKEAVMSSKPSGSRVLSMPMIGTSVILRMARISAGPLARIPAAPPATAAAAKSDMSFESRKTSPSPA